MRRGIGAGIFRGTAAALLLTVALQSHSAGASSKSKPRMTAEAIKQAIDQGKGAQLVTFPDTPWSPVKVVRGSSPAKDQNAQKPGGEKAEIAEIVTFGNPQTRPVRVARGETDHVAEAPGRPRPANVTNMQVVTFADPRDQPVSILRGSVPHVPDVELFGAASAADLDRVAFAVDGAESSHGADFRMWRPEPSGPQGPMQVTAAAAIDVGGGDRFDIAENRSLGRAYLARMYRRYGNWPDAIAAYNWGPANVDAWIGGGRPVDKFPLEVERYCDRVLRDAVLLESDAMILSGGWPSRAATGGR
jgi:hypothetical protein